jgi:hypothetical protein
MEYERSKNIKYAKRTQWYVYGKSMSFQKTLIITNKAILKIDHMNVTISLTNDYNRLDTWYRGKNKAISNPICLSPAPIIWCGGFLVDFYFQLIKMVNSSLTISPLNDKISQIKELNSIS